jgi:hypothetical protein
VRFSEGSCVVLDTAYKKAGTAGSKRLLVCPQATFKQARCLFGSLCNCSAASCRVVFCYAVTWLLQP